MGRQLYLRERGGRAHFLASQHPWACSPSTLTIVEGHSCAGISGKPMLADDWVGKLHASWRRAAAQAATYPHVPEALALLAAERLEASKRSSMAALEFAPLSCRSGEGQRLWCRAAIIHPLHAIRSAPCPSKHRSCSSTRVPGNGLQAHKRTANKQGDGPPVTAHLKACPGTVDDSNSLTCRWCRRMKRSQAARGERELPQELPLCQYNVHPPGGSSGRHG